MATGYEVQTFRHIETIAKAISSQQESLASIARSLEVLRDQALLNMEALAKAYPGTVNL